MPDPVFNLLVYFFAEAANFFNQDYQDDVSLLWIYSLFIELLEQTHKLSPETVYTHEAFLKDINRINDLTNGAIELNSSSYIDSDDKSDARKLLSINVNWISKLSLIFLYDQMNSVTRSSSTKINTKVPDIDLESKSNSPFLYLTHLLSWENPNKDIFNMTTKSNQLKQLELLINKESSFSRLQKEKLQILTAKKKFYHTCQDQSHLDSFSKLFSSQLKDTYNNSNNFYLPHKLSDRSLEQCLINKIHYIPIIRPQTDLKLGDCSYLDTCYKFSTCRYLHYRQLHPDHFIFPEADHGIEADNLENTPPMFDFTFGETIGEYLRPIPPSQWINCDIRKLDFKILGKFSAIIADPPWNIHMVLPYGTCNDVELLNLPMELLQDEGLLLLWVTGRSIEIGRQSFIKWGYKIIDEMIWIKTNQLGRTICTGRTGHWLNHSKEHLLVGVKGDSKWISCGLDTDVIVSMTRETSRKPDEVYDIVERLVGKKSRKLEIFGRDHNRRPGWLTIGNQLSGDHIVEKDLYEKYTNFKSSSSKTVAS